MSSRRAARPLLPRKPALPATEAAQRRAHAAVPERRALGRAQQHQPHAPHARARFLGARRRLPRLRPEHRRAALGNERPGRRAGRLGLARPAPAAGRALPLRPLAGQHHRRAAGRRERRRRHAGRPAAGRRLHLDSRPGGHLPVRLAAAGAADQPALRRRRWAAPCTTWLRRRSASCSSKAARTTAPAAPGCPRYALRCRRCSGCWAGVGSRAGLAPHRRHIPCFSRSISEAPSKSRSALNPPPAERPKKTRSSGGRHSPPKIAIKLSRAVLSRRYGNNDGL